MGDLAVQMGKKDKTIISSVVILIVLAVLFISSYFYTRGTQGTEFHDTPLNLYQPDPNHSGTVTIYDESLQEVFQYSGQINIQNDGKDGNPICIYINTSDAGKNN